MAKVTSERFLDAVPKNSEFSISLPEMALRFSCSRTAVSKMAKELESSGKIQIFRVYGATHHYRRKT